MISNTSGVRSGWDDPALTDANGTSYSYNQLNSLIGQGAYTPGGERTGTHIDPLDPQSLNQDVNLFPRDWSSGTIDPRAVQQEYPINNTVNPDAMDLEGTLKGPQGTYKGPTDPMQQFTNAYLDNSQQDAERNNRIMYARGASALLKMTGGIINANSKYSQITSQNNFNIHMAEIQALNVASTSASAQLKEQTKGQSRAGDARLAAVAQGQSANGDLANTQASNEEVYAAQNAMNIQINSMRTIFGIQSQERQLQYSNQIAGINRDLEISHAIVSAGSEIAQGAAGMMKVPDYNTYGAAPSPDAVDWQQ
ncbi:MAG TPA: hypothetical protein VFM18_07435 [Methanosarcina sp.]|nr:hypothetical protein [Methanosarcina sp.]